MKKKIIALVVLAPVVLYAGYEFTLGVQGAYGTFKDFAGKLYRREYSHAEEMTTGSLSSKSSFQAAKQFYDINMARFIEEPFWPKYKLESSKFSKDRKKLTLSVLQKTRMKLNLRTMTSAELEKAAFKGEAAVQLKEPVYRHKVTLERDSGWKIDSHSFSETPSFDPAPPKPGVKKNEGGGIIEEFQSFFKNMKKGKKSDASKPFLQIPSKPAALSPNAKTFHLRSGEVVTGEVTLDDPTYLTVLTAQGERIIVKDDLAS